ncbi:geobacillin-26 family protein [Paenibacillus sp. 1P03SA]|uniref:geobacillin-26 family protein n=1 Tax=Paenibacillus sp. 1P03SA TaxID=3132294 RepID=UPI0039A137E5
MKILNNKTISSTIVISMLLGSFAATGVFAETSQSDETQLIYQNQKFSSGLEIKSIKDEKDTRTVTAVENGINTVATFDKEKNTLKLEVENQEPILLDLNAISKSTNSNNNVISPQASLGQNTWSNFEYDINMVSPSIWELRRPDPQSPVTMRYYKKVTQTTGNQGTLKEFKTAVDDINMLEYQVIGYASASVLTTIIGVIVTGISAGTGAGTMIVALGLTGKMLDTALKLDRRCNDAYYLYFQV